jgi:hypothetical protein
MEYEKYLRLIQSLCDEQTLNQAVAVMLDWVVDDLSTARDWHEEHDRWEVADQLTVKIEFFINEISKLA